MEYKVYSIHMGQLNLHFLHDINYVNSIEKFYIGFILQGFQNINYGKKFPIGFLFPIGNIIPIGKFSIGFDSLQEIQKAMEKISYRFYISYRKYNSYRKIFHTIWISYREFKTLWKKFPIGFIFPIGNRKPIGKFSIGNRFPIGNLNFLQENFLQGIDFLSEIEISYRKSNVVVS